MTTLYNVRGNIGQVLKLRNEDEIRIIYDYILNQIGFEKLKKDTCFDAFFVDGELKEVIIFGYDK